MDAEQSEPQPEKLMADHHAQQDPQAFQLDPNALLETYRNKVGQLTDEVLNLTAAFRQTLTQLDEAKATIVRLRAQLGEDVEEQDTEDVER